MDRIIYKIINLKDEKDFKEKEDYYNIYINLIKAIDLIFSMRKIITTKYLSLDELNIYKYILKLTYYYQKLFNKILTIDEIKEIIEEFKGLKHRMQLIRKINEISFVNDSKATNAESTENALKAYENIFWIVGGKAKEGGIEGLKPYFHKIKKAYLIGESAQNFADFLQQNNVDFEIYN